MSKGNSWLAVVCAIALGACGVSGSSEIDLSLTLELPCTADCLPGHAYRAKANIDNQSDAGDLYPIFNLIPTGEIAGAFTDNADVPSGEVSHISNIPVVEADELYIDIDFVCGGAGGTLEVALHDGRVMATSGAQDIRCPGMPGPAIEDANVLGLVTVTNNEAGQEAVTTFGGIALYPTDSTQLQRDTARDAAIHEFYTAPLGSCTALPNPNSSDITRLDIPAGVSFPHTGGGTPLDFAATTGFLASTPELGATYDGEILTSADFAGIDAAALVLIPDLPTDVVAGTLIGQGDPSGFSPGYNLGVYASTATTDLPTITFTPPDGVTNVVVRIFDPHMNDADPASLTVCTLAPTATSFTMPADVFAAAGLNTSGQFYDTISMDVEFAEISIAPVTTTTTDEQVLSVSVTTEKNIFFRKQ